MLHCWNNRWVGSIWIRNRLSWPRFIGLTLLVVSYLIQYLSENRHNNYLISNFVIRLVSNSDCCVWLVTATKTKAFILWSRHFQWLMQSDCWRCGIIQRSAVDGLWRKLLKGWSFHLTLAILRLRDSACLTPPVLLSLHLEPVSPSLSLAPKCPTDSPCLSLLPPSDAAIVSLLTTMCTSWLSRLRILIVALFNDVISTG
jgi:hypothetical protein